jgi:peptidoglycan lytic transglycosylase G
LSRYTGRQRRDREELATRLDALRASRPKRHRKRRSNAGPTVLGLLLVLGIFGAIYLIYATATGEDEAVTAGPAKVTVVKGDTLSSVSQKLEEAGVIGSSTLFEVEARIGGHSTELKPGEYTFRRGEDSDAILAKLTAGEAVPTYAVTIPEGLTLHETAEVVGEQNGVPAAKFEEAAKRTDYGYAFLEDPAIRTTEGFLFPKRYDFEEGTTAPQMVDRLLEQYLLETQDLDFEAAKQRLNLTEYEIVTVASLIERESANSEERPIIASVIYNRIQRGMPLQIDATIQYALGEPKEELSLADLKVRSPYNTYENEGLPPGPICSPSRESLQAAIEPAQTDYLYYVLDAEGDEHFFTDNYQEFLKVKQKRDATLTRNH